MPGERDSTAPHPQLCSAPLPPTASSLERRGSALGADNLDPRALGRGAGAPGGGRGKGREGGAGGGRQQRPAVPAPQTLAAIVGAQRRPALRACPSLPLRSPGALGQSPALSADRRTDGRPREPRSAPPEQAMWIAPPGPAGGISTARPVAPATSGDYDPESAALPGPPLSQPGHGLPPDRVSAARASLPRLRSSVRSRQSWLGPGGRRDTQLSSGDDCGAGTLWAQRLPAGGHLLGACCSRD